jgi:hypothetical protein
MKKAVLFLFIIAFGILHAPLAISQGFGFPTKKWGVGFGNFPSFTGIRINGVDKDVELIKGINVSSWITKDFVGQTGSFYGLGIGLPMAMGTENRYGASVGLFATGAIEDLFGVKYWRNRRRWQ